MISVILINALLMFRRVLQILIFARIIMSWFRPRSFSRETQWFFRLEEIVWRLTEPFLGPFRRLLPMSGMGMDFSPIIAILAIDFATRLLVAILIRLPF